MSVTDPGHPELDLSVVVPAHNETGFLDQCVADLLTGLRRGDRSFEIVVVENGSTDGTPELAARLAAQDPEVVCVSLPTADYGVALRTGLLRARGAVVVNFDVDYYDLGFLDQAWALAHEPPGAAIVVGSKRMPGTVDTRPWMRRLVTATFSTLLRFGFGLRVSDTHGMKLLRRAEVEPLARACRFGTDLFDTELVLRAERAGLRVTELPVTVVERRPARTPILKRVPRTIVGLVRLRLALLTERFGARDRAATGASA